MRFIATAVCLTAIAVWTTGCDEQPAANDAPPAGPGEFDPGGPPPGEVPPGPTGQGNGAQPLPPDGGGAGINLAPSDTTQASGSFTPDTPPGASTDRQSDADPFGGGGPPPFAADEPGDALLDSSPESDISAPLLEQDVQLDLGGEEAELSVESGQ